MSTTARRLEQPREKELWARHSRERDPAATEELIRTYLPLAERFARRYTGVSEPYDDLFQVASLGLINAVERFDPSLGTPFIGFAKPTILGEIKRYFRDKVWTVRVPRSVHDLMGKVEKASERLALQLHRPPSVAELAEHLGVAARRGPRSPRGAREPSAAVPRRAARPTPKTTSPPNGRAARTGATPWPNSG